MSKSRQQREGYTSRCRIAVTKLASCHMIRISDDFFPLFGKKSRRFLPRSIALMDFDFGSSTSLTMSHKRLPSNFYTNVINKKDLCFYMNWNNSNTYFKISLTVRKVFYLWVIITLIFNFTRAKSQAAASDI